MQQTDWRRIETALQHYFSAAIRDDGDLILEFSDDVNLTALARYLADALFGATMEEENDDDQHQADNATARE